MQSGRPESRGCSGSDSMSGKDAGKQSRGCSWGQSEESLSPFLRSFVPSSHSLLLSHLAALGEGDQRVDTLSLPPRVGGGRALQSGE